MKSQCRVAVGGIQRRHDGNCWATCLCRADWRHPLGRYPTPELPQLPHACTIEYARLAAERGHRSC